MEPWKRRRRASAAVSYTHLDVYKRQPQALEEIRQLKELCDANGIELVIFTNPMHVLTYEKAVENGYRDFLSGLAQVTDFYNFSGINDITTNNDNYLETSHYMPQVGDRMLDVMFKGQADERLLEQGFGYRVTLSLIHI